MSTIFGIFNRDDSVVKKEIIATALQDLDYWKSDGKGYWVEGNLGFGHLLLTTTRESLLVPQPYMDPDSGCIIVADARIDYQSELLKNIFESEVERPTHNDAKLLLEAYLKWGEDCLKNIYGDFTFAIYDPRSAKLFCARDHFGCKPFFYYLDEKNFVFSSELSGIIRLPFLKHSIDDNWIADILISKPSDLYRTSFKDIFRLLPAHSLVITKDAFNRKRYWDFREQLQTGRNDDNVLIEEFRGLLKSSIISRIPTIAPVGVELSGGLDSSGIAAIASSFCNENGVTLHALSHILSQRRSKNNGQEVDESDLSKKIVSHAEISTHLMISGEEEGVLNSIKRILLLNNSPNSESYSMMSDILYEKAYENEIRVLLSGFGGDEGVSLQGNVVLQELVGKKDFSQLLRELKQKSELPRFIIYKKVFSFTICSYFPSFCAAISSLLMRKNIKLEKYNSFGIDADFEQAMNTQEIYSEWRQPWSSGNLKERQRERMAINGFPYRLEFTSIAAQSRRIEVRYPLLDVKLVEFYYNLPSRMKYRNGLGRYIYRAAMRGIIPDEIRLREDKSALAIPSMISRIIDDLDQFEDIIFEGKLNNKFHYVNYEKMLWMIEQVKAQKENSDVKFDPMVLINHIQVLILQQWQRQGKLDIGIKC